MLLKHDVPQTDRSIELHDYIVFEKSIKQAIYTILVYRIILTITTCIVSIYPIKKPCIVRNFTTVHWVKSKANPLQKCFFFERKMARFDQFFSRSKNVCKCVKMKENG